MQGEEVGWGGRVMTHRSGFPELTSVLFASGAWSCGSRALQKADLHFPRVKGDGELARLEEFSGILHLLSPSKRAWWSGGSWTTSGWVCWAQWCSYCAQQTVPWPGGVKADFSSPSLRISIIPTSYHGNAGLSL